MSTPTKILPCTCEHEYQDKLYKGKRIFIKNNNGYSCSVCKKSYNSLVTDTKKKNK